MKGKLVCVDVRDNNIPTKGICKEFNKDGITVTLIKEEYEECFIPAISINQILIKNGVRKMSELIFNSKK